MFIPPQSSKVNVRDIESTLDNVVFLYGYISEKDVFERYARMHSVACTAHPCTIGILINA